MQCNYYNHQNSYIANKCHVYNQTYWFSGSTGSTLRITGRVVLGKHLTRYLVPECILGDRANITT